MSVWDDGYMTDLDYIDSYMVEMSPLLLNFNLALEGIQVGHPDKIAPAANFSYLELGFGFGTSLAVHAVTSEGEFVGTDFNPSHALIAQNRVKGTKANIKIYEYSFEELYEKLHEQKAEFDYIVLHGIYSWVSEHNQEIILKIIREFLRAGGVVYNGYNAFPGWIQKAASRQLLYLYNLYASGTPQDKIQGGVKFLSEFLKSGSLYAKKNADNAQMAEKLQNFINNNRGAYIAHEYYNTDWHCFYFYDMVQHMQKAKCSFAGSARALEHFNDMHLTPENMAFIDSVKDPIFKEQLKDYYTLPAFRVDLFTKGAIHSSQFEGQHRFLNTEYVLIKPITAFKFTITTTKGQLQFDEEFFGKMLEYLQSQAYRPKSGYEIMEAYGGGVNFNRILNALCIMIQQNILLPAQKVTQKIHKQTEAFNQNLLKQQDKGIKGGYLASPVTAHGIRVNDMQACILKAYMSNCKNATDITEYAFKIFKAQGRKCMEDGKTLTEDSENKAMIIKNAQEFLDQRLALFKALGIC